MIWEVWENRLKRLYEIGNLREYIVKCVIIVEFWVLVRVVIIRLYVCNYRGNIRYSECEYGVGKFCLYREVMFFSKLFLITRKLVEFLVLSNYDKCSSRFSFIELWRG